VHAKLGLQLTVQVNRSPKHDIIKLSDILPHLTLVLSICANGMGRLASSVGSEKREFCAGTIVVTFSGSSTTRLPHVTTKKAKKLALQ